MTTIGIERPAGAGRERGFFTGMAVLVALVVAAGFGPSYSASLPPPGLPFWVHLHGAVMTAWIALFAVQAWLVGRRKLALHRKLGWASVALVAAMLPLGAVTNAMAIRRGATPPFFTPAEMMAADLVDILIFVGLYTAAVVLRRKGDWHKRLMLSATIALSWPAVARLIPLRGLGLANIIPASAVILVLMALAGPLYDLATRRKPHPAYLWGVVPILLLLPLYNLVAHIEPVAGWARALAAKG